MKRYGTAERLVVQKNKMYSLVNGELVQDAEVVTFLDYFIERHPDFSWHGAKGIIAITGYKGMLGYMNDEYDQAKIAADYLKGKGWEFASHGYAHLSETRSSAEQLDHDCYLWKSEVEPVVGKTDIHIFPYGHSLKEDDPLSGILYKYGFTNSFGVFCKTEWLQEKNRLYGDQIPIDGQYLMGLTEGSRYSQFCEIDQARKIKRVFKK
jgi:hypothetical protein